MITRDVSQLYVVPAFTHNVRFISCTVNTLTCARAGATSAIGSSEFWPGYTLDRLGLPRSFASVALVPTVVADVIATEAAPQQVIVTISAGLQHTSASGGTWANYSTGDWLVQSGLWLQTTSTSTGKDKFTAIQRDVGLTSEIGIGGILATATATCTIQQTSTGAITLAYYAGPPAVFDLGGAKRYIRSVLRFQHETTADWGGVGACAVAGGAIFGSGTFVFGEPGEAQPTGVTKRILVTTGCST